MLGSILEAEAFGFILITLRMASIVMFVPVFGDRSIPQRMRVALAMAISVIVYGTMRDQLPPMPKELFGLVDLFVREFLVGAMLGLMIRVLMAATHTAGSVIAFQTGLAAARAFDPAQGQQSVVVAAFINLVAITTILVTDIHHMMIEGIAHSYYKFPIGETLYIEDFATTATQMVAASFLLGFQLASPFIVYGMIYNLGLGLLARMVPGFQVFFIGMPINIFMGFVLMSLLLGGILTLFLEHFQRFLAAILG
jgi:flagellar biosynthetic protein FliR